MGEAFTLLREWGPAYLGWVLGAGMLWAYFRLVARIIELVQTSTSAHNANAAAQQDVAKVLEKVESRLERLPL